MENKLLIAALFGILLFASPAFAPADLGNFSFTNVLIRVTYTDTVSMEGYTIRGLTNLGELYDLDMVGSDIPSDYFEFKPVHPSGDDIDSRKPLLPGQYELALIAVDLETQSSLPEWRVFSILGLDIELTKPVHGVATTSPFEMEWTTRNEGQSVLAECRWSTSTLVEWIDMYGTEEGTTPSSTHHPDCDWFMNPPNLCDNTEDNEIDYIGDIFILCVEPSGRETPAIFHIGHDSSPPTLDITVIPTIVNDEDNKWAVIRVETDDETTCTVDGTNFPGEDPADTDNYVTFHEVIYFYDTITDNSEHVFTYDLECTNKAGLSADGTATVTVDLDYASNIDIIYPPEEVDFNEYTLVAEPLFTADTCTVNGDDMTVSGSEFERDFAPPEVREGDNPYDIHCIGPVEEATRLYVVTVALEGECDSANDCDNGQMCIDEVCEDPSGDTCFDDLDCPQGEICDDGECIFPEDGCSTPFDCPDITWACIDGACFPPTGDDCSSNLDCVSPETCENGICGYIPPPGSNESCILSVDCPNAGEECVNGLCILPQPPPTTCFTDFDCPDLDDQCLIGVCVSPGGDGAACVLSSDCPSFDEICVNGVCIARENPTTIPPPPNPDGDTDGDTIEPEKKTDWWAIILIILGILIMGGCGYFLWFENEQKRQERARKVQQPQMQQGARADPGQAAMIEKALEERKKAVAAMQKQKAAEQTQKKEGRHEAFDAFGSGSKKSKKKAPAKKAVKKSTKKPASKKEDTAFDELEKLGKK